MRRLSQPGFGAVGLAMVFGLASCTSNSANPFGGSGGRENDDASTSSGGGRGGGAGGTSGDGGRAATSGGSSGAGTAGGGGTGPGGSGGTGGANAGDTGGANTGTGGEGTGGTNTGGGGGGGSGGAGTGGSNDAGTGGSGDYVVTLTVDVSANVRPISPLIYGVNAEGIACSNPSARFTLCRRGTNPWSTYNWENNASNAGDGRCFENDDGLGGSNDPGKTVTALIDEAGARASLVTMPIGDHVAADKNGGSAPPGCDGDVRKSGSDYLDTRFKSNHARKGSALSASPDTTDDSVYQDEFVSFVKAHAPTAQLLFAMDNQPELWSFTHLAAHPAHATYAEVVAKNIEYATMVREQWPEAKITGGVGYGFQAFLDLQTAPDAAGKPDFISYYLAQMKKAADDAGKRLVDYLDVHWYSSGGVGGVRVIEPDSTPPDPAMVAARVQAARSLWDPTYNEGSWINDQLGGPINLLGWFGTRIVANYPGTKLAFSVWSHGGDEHISGAIAAADTLGVFGREGVAVAAAQASVPDTSFLVGAFAAYRNYDGAGASFGDTSVAATTSDIARMAIYASTDSAVPDRVVLIVINRGAASVATTLSLQHARTFSTADVFQITSASPLPEPATGLVATGANTFSYKPPGYSVSIVVPKP
jgi:hypothetical protein